MPTYPPHSPPACQHAHAYLSNSLTACMPHAYLSTSLTACMPARPMPTYPPHSPPDYLHVPHLPIHHTHRLTACTPHIYLSTCLTAHPGRLNGTTPSLTRPLPYHLTACVPLKVQPPPLPLHSHPACFCVVLPPQNLAATASPPVCVCVVLLPQNLAAGSTGMAGVWTGSASRRGGTGGVCR